MAIPDFQTLMLPFLEAVEDGNEHPFKDVVNKLAVEFRLTQDELAEMLPSRRALTFYNRVAWAKFYLKKAGLIAQIKRGYLGLTEQGKKALNSKPTQINIKYLEQFPEYLSFKENISTDSPTEKNQWRWNLLVHRKKFLSLLTASLTEVWSLRF